MPYIGVSPTGGVRKVFSYTATAGQTSFSGSDNNSQTLSYSDSNFIDVFQNGVLLLPSDYTATTGTSVVLDTGATVSDSIQITVFDVFSAADTVSKADGGTFDGAVSFAGNIDVDGTANLDVVDIDGAVDMASTLQVDGSITSSNSMTITTADNNPQLTLVSTDADENVGPEIDLYRNSASPADGDILGRLVFNGENDAGEKIDYANIQFRIVDASDGTEDGRLLIVKKLAGADVGVMSSNNTETVFNDDSADMDFRVEGNGNTHALFVQGGSDGVGIGNDSPNSFGATTDNLVIGTTSGENGMTIVSGTANSGRIQFADNTSDPFRGAIEYAHGSTDALMFYTAGSKSMQITSSQEVGIGLTDPAAKLQVNTANMGNLDAVCLKNETNNVGGYFVRFRRSSNAEIGSIEQTGGGATVSYNTSSDYRLKENVDYTFDATTRLKQLKPARFNFIGDTATVDGFLAHEVSDIVPHAISGKKDAMTKEVLYVDGDEIPEGKKVGDVKEESQIAPQGIDHSKLVPLLTKTLQEALTRIDTLEAKVTALEKGE